jgi:gliding motility-associated-like protein/uncharacterized repeat protein (TIGR01451 family)
LNGTPDGGGTWSNIGNSYTYTVAATGTCTVAATATVTVTIQDAPDAGGNGTLTICEGTTPSDSQLFTSLTGTPDAGGTWSNVGNSYTYTVAATAPCTGAAATATVTVTIEDAPDAGADGTLTICEGTTPSDSQLFTSLTGTPDAGGTWSNVGNSYTYTVAVTGTCTVAATATVTVTENDAADAGTDGAITICEGAAQPTEPELFASLTAADAGGVWSGPVAGVYTYTVTETGACPSEDTATVTVIAATDGTITICEGITIVKQADKTEISQIGEVINYTLTITNTGRVTLTDVTVADPLTGLIELVGTLLPGEVKVVPTRYTVTSLDIEKTTLVNVATVTGTLPSGTTIEDDSSVSVVISANEIIANDDDFGTYFVGYSGRLGNILENDRLNGVRPNDVDVDFEFTELDNVVGLLIDENGELSLIPGVNEAREYTLKYTLREVVNPSNSDDAFLVFRLLNDQVDLSVTKTSLGAEIFEGDEFEYQITLTNIGGTPATNVLLVDDLPNAVTYISSRVESVSGSQIEVGTPAITGSRVTWTVPFLPADGRVVIVVMVKAGAAGSITNVARISASEDDTDELNNQGSDVNLISENFIPNVITPNNDGDNDAFEIKGLGKFVSNKITIFNRYGDHVLEQKAYKNDWNAPGQVAGTYFYILTTVDSSGKAHTFKGWIQVIKPDMFNSLIQEIKE